MPTEYTNDYLLDKKVDILQPINGYRASSDAVLLAAFVSQNKEGCRILDVGSGTGAVSLCLAHRLQSLAPQIDGFEIQSDLVELSNLSAQKNKFINVEFHNVDIRAGFTNSKFSFCSYDAVVTNPPYSDHDMPSPNLSKATAHNHQNFNLTEWLKFCFKMTKPFGKIYVINRAEALQEICAVAGKQAAVVEIMPIYSKQKQQAKRILVCLQKDSKTPCKILEPFITHDDKGNYTAKAQKILRGGASFDDVNEI